MAKSFLVITLFDLSVGQRDGGKRQKNGLMLLC